MPTIMRGGGTMADCRCLRVSQDGRPRGDERHCVYLGRRLGRCQHSLIVRARGKVGIVGSLASTLDTPPSGLAWVPLSPWESRAMSDEAAVPGGVPTLHRRQAGPLVGGDQVKDAMSGAGHHEAQVDVGIGVEHTPARQCARAAVPDRPYT